MKAKSVQKPDKHLLKSLPEKIKQSTHNIHSSVWPKLKSLLVLDIVSKLFTERKRKKHRVKPGRESVLILILRLKQVKNQCLPIHWIFSCIFSAEFYLFSKVNIGKTNFGIENNVRFESTGFTIFISLWKQTRLKRMKIRIRVFENEIFEKWITVVTQHSMLTVTFFFKNFHNFISIF